MHKAYKKECMLTLFAFLLAAFITHLFPVYFLFPELTRMEMFGFPAHYFLTLFLGWVAAMPLYYFYMVWSEKVDAEIANSGNEAGEQVIANAAEGDKGDAKVALGGAQ
jgi:putative solute:sodium symporter small subunit